MLMSENYEKVKDLVENLFQYGFLTQHAVPGLFS
jgi:hypothetical protein